MLAVAKLNGKPEVFFTIQGEGRNIGMPAVFVRLSLCSLHCCFCDSDYTWAWQGSRFTGSSGKQFNKSEQIVRMTSFQVAEEIKKHNCQNVVLTGGEPLLQQKQFVEVMELLPGYNFEVETAGVVNPIFEFDTLVKQYNVSPKLENSGNELQRREKPEVLSRLAINPKAIFKFVVVNQQDLDEIQGLVDRYKLQVVYVMPEGVTVDQLMSRSEWLIEECKVRGWYFTPRLHILVYGNRRGT